MTRDADRKTSSPAAPAGFVVWLSEDDGGERGGIVERVRTGEKRRFARLGDLPALIARMAGGVPAPAKEETT